MKIFKNKTLSSVLLLIAVCVIAATGIYFFINKNGDSQTSQENVSSYQEKPVSQAASVEVPASWKTFSDSAYGFTVKYPPDWTIHSDSSPHNKKEAVVTFFSPVHTDLFGTQDAYYFLSISLTEDGVKAISSLGAGFYLAHSGGETIQLDQSIIGATEEYRAAQLIFASLVTN
jgi:hypothetical protein